MGDTEADAALLEEAVICDPEFVPSEIVSATEDEAPKSAAAAVAKTVSATPKPVVVAASKTMPPPPPRKLLTAADVAEAAAKVKALQKQRADQEAATLKFNEKATKQPNRIPKKTFLSSSSSSRSKSQPRGDDRKTAFMTDDRLGERSINMSISRSTALREHLGLPNTAKRDEVDKAMLLERSASRPRSKSRSPTRRSSSKRKSLSRSRSRSPRKRRGSRRRSRSRSRDADAKKSYSFDRSRSQPAPPPPHPYDEDLRLKERRFTSRDSYVFDPARFLRENLATGDQHDALLEYFCRLKTSGVNGYHVFRSKDTATGAGVMFRITRC